MYDEDNYLRALASISDNHLNEKDWLINNFELYKQTLNWPDNLPPIGRSNLIKGSLREKFNSTYKDLLSEFEHKFNNESKTVNILEKELFFTSWRERHRFEQEFIKIAGSQIKKFKGSRFLCWYSDKKDPIISDEFMVSLTTELKIEVQELVNSLK